MKVAIVQEWLVTLGGSELVLAELLKVFPNAHVFTLVDKMSATDKAFLGVGETTTSFLQNIPGIERRYRNFLPLFPAAVRSLNVSAFDVVISNSHAVSKGVRTRPGQLHVSYCLSPMRYAWDLREQYLHESGNDKGVRGVLARTMLEGLRRWDKWNSKDVDVFATLSHYIGDRIQRAYARTSTVIYPPVDTEFFTPVEGGGSGGDYVTASRFVPYKRIDIIAQAFRELADRKLIIIGEGPDDEKIRRAAGTNVRFLGRVRREELRTCLRAARAFIFAAEEDFGIAPVEAQACGTPVIAFGRGGAVETVRGESGASGEERTGVFFEHQTPEAIAAAVRTFESMSISRRACRVNAERFTEARFRSEFRGLVDREWAGFHATAVPVPQPVRDPG